MESEFQESLCPGCEFEQQPIGILGDLLHYNCRLCDLWWSEPREEEK